MMTYNDWAIAGSLIALLVLSIINMGVVWRRYKSLGFAYRWVINGLLPFGAFLVTIVFLVVAVAIFGIVLDKLAGASSITPFTLLVLMVTYFIGVIWGAWSIITKSFEYKYKDSEISFVLDMKRRERKSMNKIRRVFHMKELYEG